MPKFELTGVVDRVVSDTIYLLVEAKNFSEAVDNARKVLETYPQAHAEDGSVKECFTQDREHRHLEIVEIKLKEDA